MPSDRRWSDTDRELVKRAAAGVPRPGEGAWLNAGTFGRYWDQVTDAVLDALTAAGRLFPERDDGATYDEMARWWDEGADIRAGLTYWSADA